MKVSRLTDTERRRLDRATETSNTVRVGAWTVAALALVLGTLSIAIALATGSRPELSLMAWVMISPVLGLLLVVRGGAVRMGGLLLAIGLAGAIAALVAATPSDPRYLSWLWVVSVGSAGWVCFIALTLVGLPMLFPTGHPPSKSWCPVLWLFAVVMAAGAVMAMFGPEVEMLCSNTAPATADCTIWEAEEAVLRIARCDEAKPGSLVIECNVFLENPIGIAGVPLLEGSDPGDVVWGGLLLAAVLALVSMGVRMWTAASRERQQIKVLFMAVGLLIFWTLVEALWVDALGREVPLPVENVMEFIYWTAIPVAIYLAITRYRLYDIDRLISRTVSYAIVVGLLVGGVVSVATLVGTRFNSPLVVAATTLGVAAVFNPLRRRVQRVVDRRFNRSRYDHERVIQSFTLSLRDQVEPDAVLAGLTTVVEQTIQPAGIGIWVR